MFCLCYSVQRGSQSKNSDDLMNDQNSDDLAPQKPQQKSKKVRPKKDFCMTLLSKRRKS